ncbi:MAG: ABC transporter ATP-binding protein [Rhodospirillaceae bacterium]|nr:MAG: ABC transporter ATP-binding protein [Rhodospirillaceae bacterium]
MGDLVQVSNLRVVAGNDAGKPVPIVKDVSFSIPRGEVLALIGESGSGKTTIALTLMGYARPGCRIAGGSVRIDGAEVLDLNRDELTALRGCKVAYVAQSAAAAFNPSKTIIDQVVEVVLIRGLMTRAVAEAKAIDLFRALALPDPEQIGGRYPHQVSGGQLQRMMAAMALITDPALVIFDEPTTALDVTTQIEVLRAFKKVVKDRGTTAVYVSHDLSVVSQMATRIVVLRHGEVREVGLMEQILHAPEDAYTQALMAAARPARRHALSTVAVANPAPPLLEIRGLTAGYGRRDSRGVPCNIVLKNIDLQIRQGRTLGVIGESGSGKSTLARVSAGLLPPADGTVLFNGEPLAPGLTGRTRDQFRRIQIVFQNADTALNPSHSVARILGRPLEFYHGLRGAARDRRIKQLLDLIRLPVNIATRRASELSGGQKQRINLARALAAEPDLILCDEVTSALDTVVGAAILDLMGELRRELNVSYMFISHDISTVRSICDDVVVLYAGQKVESENHRPFQAPPYHPYTDQLISSVPEMRSGWLEESGAVQTPPYVDPVNCGTDLCCFLVRCPVRINGVCNVAMPPRVTLGNGNEILCHHSDADLRRLYSPSHMRTDLR